jgi:hypothetical protein
MLIPFFRVIKYIFTILSQFTRYGVLDLINFGYLMIKCCITTFKIQRNITNLLTNLQSLLEWAPRVLKIIHFSFLFSAIAKLVFNKRNCVVIITKNISFIYIFVEFSYTYLTISSKCGKFLNNRTTFDKNEFRNQEFVFGKYIYGKNNNEKTKN